MTVSVNSTSDMLDYSGLSAYLKMAQGTLRRKVMRGEIPFFKIGRSVRFSKIKIDIWLEANNRKLKEKEKKHIVNTNEVIE